ncbi:MAG: hypothetical protein RLP13_02630 [Cytophagales bacterium]
MKKCPECGEMIKGRSDKIYCSLNCKSAAQYGKRLKNEELYLKVDKQLKTNRKLLKKYNRAGKSTVRKQVLLEVGFNPKYFTNYWKNKNGDVYLFCYEFGFMELKEHNKEKFLLVQWQDYMN